jgi:hypothetical protein
MALTVPLGCIRNDKDIGIVGVVDSPRKRPKEIDQSEFCLEVFDMIHGVHICMTKAGFDMGSELGGKIVVNEDF